jgi:hypothetical protein
VGDRVTLGAHGLRIELPMGWSGRVFARAAAAATLHAGDFQIALTDGEFGDRSTGMMPATASFIAVTEYVPGEGLEPGRGLFAARKLPLPLDPTSFSARRLAHARPGQVGTQHFFTSAGRPFCLYLVISGRREARRRQLAVLDHALRSLQVRSRTPR